MLKLKIVLGLSLCLAFFSACGPKESKEERQYHERVGELIRDMSERSKALEQQATDMKIRIATRLAQAYRENRPGGQPGNVRLRGAFVINETTLDSRVGVQLLAGTAWDGTTPEVASGTLKVSREVLHETLEDHKTFVSYGCSDRHEMNGLVETTGTEDIVQAHTVLICDASRIGDKVKQIIASVVVLSNVNLEIKNQTEFQFRRFELYAEELILEGTNKISAADFSSDSFIPSRVGPDLSLAALQLRGNGTLEIVSKGADHK